MRATGVLQKSLSSALDSMHALLSRVLLRAVEAMIRGRRLTLIDQARAWPGAERNPRAAEGIGSIVGKHSPPC
jgi:hypothetical protein